MTRGIAAWRCTRRRPPGGSESESGSRCAAGSRRPTRGRRPAGELVVLVRLVDRDPDTRPRQHSCLELAHRAVHEVLARVDGGAAASLARRRRTRASDASRGQHRDARTTRGWPTSPASTRWTDADRHAGALRELAHRPAPPDAVRRGWLGRRRCASRRSAAVAAERHRIRLSGRRHFGWSERRPSPYRAAHRRSEPGSHRTCVRCSSVKRRSDGRSRRRARDASRGGRRRSPGARCSVDPKSRRDAVSRGGDALDAAQLAGAGSASFSIRIAVALNSAVPDLGSVASIVRLLVVTSSWKWSVMNARPGPQALVDADRRLDVATPRDHAHPLAVGEAQPRDVLGRQVERLAPPPRVLVAARLDAGVVRVQVAAGRQADREVVVEAVDRRVVLDRHERRPVARHRVLPQPRVEEQLARVVLVLARPLDPARAPRAARSSSRDGPATARGPRSRPSRGRPRPSRRPSAFARSKMIRRSSRASPGGSSAGRTSWTRRSEFVTVPRLSAHAAAAGNTTSAISPVAVRKMSWTIRVSRPRRSFSVRWRSASDCIGFSPITYSALSSPRSIASNISDRCQPRLGGTRTPHRLSHLSRSSSFSTCWKPDQPVRERAHVAAALDVVLAAERVDAAAVLPDVPGQQRERDQRRARCRPRCGAR